MTYTNDGYWTVKAKKWIEEERNTVNPGNLEVSFQHGVLAFAQFLDGEEEHKCCWQVDEKWTGPCAHCGKEKPTKKDKPCEFCDANDGYIGCVETSKRLNRPCPCICHRKEDKPVCGHGPDGCNGTYCKSQPKPEPIEELSGGVVYADARDEVSKKIAEQMARKIIELQNKLNEVIRRLNAITK